MGGDLEVGSGQDHRPRQVMHPRLEYGQGVVMPMPGKPDYRQVSAPGHCPTGLAGQSGGKDSSSPDLGPA